jgi:hypothetical protein
MKVFSPQLSCLLLAMGALSLANGQQPATTQQKTYDVEAKWPGTKFTISLIKRMDVQRVMMAVQISTDTAAPNSTFLGFWPNGQPKPEPVAPKAPFKPGVPQGPPAIAEHPNPFSLMKAYVVDEANQSQFNAVPQTISTSQPFYGPTEIITTLHPGSWVQMSVQFKLPVPAPNPDGTVPVQKVDVSLPQAMAPVKGVIVPAL